MGLRFVSADALPLMKQIIASTIAGSRTVMNNSLSSESNEAAANYTGREKLELDLSGISRSAATHECCWDSTFYSPVTISPIHDFDCDLRLPFAGVGFGAWIGEVGFQPAAEAVAGSAWGCIPCNTVVPPPIDQRRVGAEQAVIGALIENRRIAAGRQGPGCDAAAAFGWRGDGNAEFQLQRRGHIDAVVPDEGSAGSLPAGFREPCE